MKINRKCVKSVLSLILCAATLFVLCACGSKTALNKAGFESKAKEYGLIVGMSPIAFGTEEASVVGKVDGSDVLWQAEFYKFSSDEDARASFDLNKADYENLGGTMTSTTLPDRATFEKSTGDQYIYLSQIGKTFLYIVVDQQYKSDVKAFIDTLGY